jgi:hypothetical protein
MRLEGRQLQRRRRWCWVGRGEIEATYPRRVATLFVYLNTLATGEGDTVFTDLDLAVQPVAGSALVFPTFTTDQTMDYLVVDRGTAITFKNHEVPNDQDLIFPFFFGAFVCPIPSFSIASFLWRWRD